MEVRGGRRRDGEGGNKNALVKVVKCLLSKEKVNIFIVGRGTAKECQWREITGRKYVKSGKKLRKHVIMNNVVSDIVSAVKRNRAEKGILH